MTIFSISAHSENSVEAANTDETITLHYFVGDGADTNSLAMYDEHNSIIYPDPNTNDNKNGKFFRLFLVASIAEATLDTTISVTASSN